MASCAHSCLLSQEAQAAWWQCKVSTAHCHGCRARIPVPSRRSAGCKPTKLNLFTSGPLVLERTVVGFRVYPPTLPDAAQQRVNEHTSEAGAKEAVSKRLPKREAPELKEFLLEWGLTQSQVSAIFLKVPSIVDLKLEDLRAKIELLERYGISQTTITRALVASPEWLKRRLDQVQALLDWLLQLGVRRGKLSTVVQRYPSILFREERTLNERAELLASDEVGVKNVALVVERNSNVLKLSREGILAKAAAIAEVFGTQESAGFLIEKAPSVMNLSPDTFRQKIAFLLGFLSQDPERSLKLIGSFPMFINSKIESLEEIKAFLDNEFGPEESARMISVCPSLLGASAEKKQGVLRYLVSVMGEEDAKGMLRKWPDVLVASLSTVQENYGKWGAMFSHEQVHDLLRRFPRALYHNWDTNVQPKIDYLTHDLGIPVDEVLLFPEYLKYSVERIRSRHEILKQAGFRVVSQRLTRQVLVKPYETKESLDIGRSVSLQGMARLNKLEFEIAFNVSLRIK